MAQLSEKEPVKPPAPPVRFRGSCICGRITWDCTDAAPQGTACYCVTCRKASGGAFQAYLDVAADTVTLYDQTERLRYEGLPRDALGGLAFRRFSHVGERAYCGECWAPLAMRYRNHRETVALTLGSVDEGSAGPGELAAIQLQVQKHIFTSQTASWYKIPEDGKPRIARFTEGFEEGIEAWQGEEAKS